MMLSQDGMNRSNSFKLKSKHKAFASVDENAKTIADRSERPRPRRNASIDTSTLLANRNTYSPNHTYYQLAERVRELEKEIAPELRCFQISPTFSPFSPLTPCSNVSANALTNFVRPQNFPMNLISPNSSVPTQRFGLSSKIFERAHQIPDRFWINWQEKQMQSRIQELEYIKHNLSNSKNVDYETVDRRKSLLLLHDNKYSTHSASIDNETSSSSTTTDELSSFQLNRQLPLDNYDIIRQRTSDIIEPINATQSIRKSRPKLDRSHLTIFLPARNATTSERINFTNEYQSLRKSILEHSIEDVAQINTEFNLTLLSRENDYEKYPFLYSKATINRTIEFRSSSSYRNENQTN